MFTNPLPDNEDYPNSINSYRSLSLYQKPATHNYAKL